jgi:hypothetical protein
MSSIIKFVFLTFLNKKKKRFFLDYHDYEMRVLASDLIILNHNNESINDQIINLLNPVC